MCSLPLVLHIVTFVYADLRTYYVIPDFIYVVSPTLYIASSRKVVNFYCAFATFPECFAHVFVKFFVCVIVFSVLEY